MSTKDAWLNVAQAAQWLAEGREVEIRARDSRFWYPVGIESHQLLLGVGCEYRIKPKPPKPREYVIEYGHDDRFRLVCTIEGMGPRAGDRIRVREVIEE